MPSSPLTSLLAQRVTPDVKSARFGLLFSWMAASTSLTNATATHSFAEMNADPIVQFWAWWPSVASRLDQGIREGAIPPEVIETISKHVSAIDPGLDWELGPGVRARHHMCLSAKGDPLLRVLTERWLHNRREDDTWEFYPARQAHRGKALTLKIAGQEVPLDEFVYAAQFDDDRELVDLGVHHPAFANIDDDKLKHRITFIGLDNALGEDGVERWVGGVELLEEAPETGHSYSELVNAVEDLAGDATGERWVVLQGEIDGSPIVVTTNRAIKRIDHLLLDLHVAITLPLAAPTEEGLTSNDEAETLNRLEDELFEALGEHAVNVGRETHAGRRVLHLHAMEGGPAAGIIDTWKGHHPEYELTVDVSADPEWDVLRRWS